LPVDDRSDQPLRAIIFDLDDTLIATRSLYTEAYLSALEPYLGRLTLPELIKLRPGAETWFLPTVVAAHQSIACLELFYRHYDALHAALFGGVYPGVKDLLAGLAQRGVKTAVFTGKSHRAWDISTRYVSLAGLERWVFGDEVDHAKPAPDGILAALDQLGVEPGEAAYMGDSSIDIAAARAAGVTPIAALWSLKGSARTAFDALAREAGGFGLDQPEHLLAVLDAREGRGRSAAI
jgi:HAD superfamily hydrolase (TIGR01509 family)